MSAKVRTTGVMGRSFKEADLIWLEKTKNDNNKIYFGSAGDSWESLGLQGDLTSPS